ncbi:DivIVA domain-containing protein [Aminipila sp.]|jgi:cell division initiation protein|uniref:DivIVA domain-containing protein n=1 Tax=Aminipila sp. TaxID=2060095 RepID=UPI001D5D5BD9|nr:DivIVA domain-containing protein [Aminipila sp.]MBE6034554.1 DivIVA domain-containing protein [Clostridiales bacterium]
MITPLDIQNKEFSKGVRGYREEEVDSFLDLLTIDLEKLIGENATLKEEVKRLGDELEKYKGSETAVVETLEAAKALMRDIAVSSEKRAEILLKNAELDAQLITREAKESIERLTEESSNLRNRFVTFKSKYKNLLESELERFDTLSNEIFNEFGDLGVKNSLQKTVVQNTKEEKKEHKAKIISEFESEVDDLKKTMINLRVGDGAQ